MKMLLKAAFSSGKHYKWLIYSFFALFAVTIANQLELLTLGVIINSASPTVSGGINDPIHLFLDKIKAYFVFSDYKLQKVAIALIFVALFKATSLFFSRYTTRILAIKISRDLRQKYFEHIQHLSMTFYQKYNIGALSTRVVGDASQIALSINSWITNYLQTPITVLSTLFFCFYLSWQLSLIIFVGVPLIVFPVRLITRRVKKITRTLQKNQEKFASVLIDFLAGIQTVKIFSMENYTCKKYREQNDDMEFLEKKTSRYDLLTRPILHFVTTFCLVVILFIGLYLMKIELPELVVFCGLLHLFYEPIRKFADENACVQRGVVAAERLFEVLHIQPEIIDEKDAIEIQSFNHEIVFNDVFFKYEKEWVLKGVSFSVKKGESVAIVGATGSGKSTILQLIPRLYEVSKGQIVIDGKPLQKYTQKSLRSLISYVPQKPFLFNDTIKDNIVYGKQVSEKELIEASIKAHAHEFIDELPLKYETHLADMGKNLSGGQQQRIAVARALLKKSNILILDEATSSLDAVSEQKIKNAIRGLQGEMTQIIVAHRLSTIEHVDKIIFIEKGIKIGEGSKDELLKNCSAFKAMWEASSLDMLEEVSV
ncbi:MAG: ABC transporter ATP-binding protein [Chlamydiae bacterium]|nr:ABC transporter ATP-binding protein [Chlamydiota bacterium]